MVVWWTGRGLFVTLIMLAAVTFPVVGAVFLGEEFPGRIPQWLVPLSMWVGWCIGGAVCWKIGTVWHRDALPGQYHTLYSVRVEHWGIVNLMLAALSAATWLWKSLHAP